VERCQFVWAEAPAEIAECVGCRFLVALRVRLGPGDADLRDGAEAWAFFDAASRRILDWKVRACFLVLKDFRLRVPSGSSQSA
jgi:hypothetical protein